METQVFTQLEQSYKRGESGRVIFTCDQLLLDPDYEPVRAQILFWKGMARQQAGPAWHGEAICCFREGLAAAGKDRPTKARLLAALGKLYALMGDCAAYEKLIKEWDRISRNKHPDVMRWGSSFWFNYGCTLDNAFRYSEAVTAFLRATELAGAFDQSIIYGLGYHNLGGAQLAQGHLPEARAAMEKAEALLPDETYGHKKLSRRAEFALAAGDYVGAQQNIMNALLHPEIDDMTRADVYYTWAQALLALERPREGYEKALQALGYAVKDVYFSGIHKINCFLQKIDPAYR